MRQQENHDDHNNLQNAVGCLPMLPVRLQHADDQQTRFHSPGVT